ncbi:DNA methyltransferase, partial [Streptomyces sp. SID2563]|nr:DNA methyltransferase [Streptomyces sp. SID2563]
GPGSGEDELRAAGVLPVGAAARRPASVLDHQEEGPDGQFALL